MYGQTPIMQDHSIEKIEVENTIVPLDTIISTSNDLIELFNLAKDEGDDETILEIEADAIKL